MRRKRKNGSILQSFTVCFVCFVGERNADMTSQSKLDPFSFNVVHGPKSAQLPGVDSELPRTEKTEETYTTGRPKHDVILIVKVQGLFEVSY